MTTVAIDHLGLAFAGYIFFAIVVAIVLGRILGLNDRPAHSEDFESQGRTRVGLDSPETSWSAYLAELERKRDRAEARRKRFKDAA